MMIYFFSNLQSAISQKMCTVSCCLNLKWNQVVVNEAGSWLGLTKVSSFKSRWFFKPVLCSRCAWDVGNVAGDVGISAYPPRYSAGISPAALLKLSTFLFLSKSLIALIVTYMSKLEHIKQFLSHIFAPYEHLKCFKYSNFHAKNLAFVVFDQF